MPSREPARRLRAGMARAADFLAIHFRPGQQVIDGAHAVPDAIVRQVLAHEQQNLSRQGVLVDRVVDFGTCVGMPELAPFTLANRIVGEHEESRMHQVHVDELVVGLHARQAPHSLGSFLRPCACWQ